MLNNHKAALKKEHDNKREKQTKKKKINPKQHDKDTHIGLCVQPAYSQILKTPNTFFFTSHTIVWN